MKNKFLLFLLLSNLIVSTKIIGQSVGISSSAVGSFIPNTSAMLDISSTSLGLLVPQTTNANLPTTLTAAAQGLLFFNTTATVPFLYVNNGTLLTPAWATLPNGTVANTLSLSGTTSLVSAVTNAGATNTSNILSLTSALTASAWSLSNGNVITAHSPVPTTYGTTPASANFLGTTNAKDLVFVANKYERLRMVSGSDNIGVGTATAGSTLEVNGTMASSITKDNFGTSTAPITSSIIYISLSTSTVGLTLYIPTAASCPNRRYIIVNTYTSSLTLSQPFINQSNISSYVFSYSSLEIISDGTSWRQIYSL